MKKYAIGHCFNVSDMFMNFKLKRLKMSNDLCKKLYSDGSKRDFAASIFIKSVELVINDIIENNVHFKLPGLGKTLAYLYMDRTEGEKFKQAFKRGKWRDVDFLESNFSGYQIAMDIQAGTKPLKHKLVYLSTNYKDKITENTNNGKQY